MCRMERDMKGRQGLRVVENDGPGHMGWLSVATTGHKAAQSSYPLADSHGGSKEIADGPEWKTMAPDIPAHKKKNQYKSAGKDEATFPQLERRKGPL